MVANGDCTALPEVMAVRSIRLHRTHSMCDSRAGRPKNRPAMNPGTQGLWLASSVVALAAAALWVIGLRAQRHRGWLHWLAALGCASGGVAVSATVPQQGLIALIPAQLLLLAWPLLTLIGVRRFHARIAWPTSTAVDAAVF